MPQPRASGNGWVVSVPIRPDAEWSDGEPITADDIVFTFETVGDLGLGGGWIAGYPVPNPDAPSQIGLTRVRAAGDRTVEFWFNQRQMERIVADEKPYLILFDAGITELYREEAVEYPFLDTLAGLQNLSGMQALVRGAK